MNGALHHATTIVHTWLRMDFFGDRSRDSGGALTGTIFSQSFFALVLAALLFDPTVSVVPFAAANLSLSTLFVGLGALADPQRAMRRRNADAVMIHTSPAPRATLPIARALHGAFYVVLITTGMALPPAILCYWVAGGSLVIVPLYIACACLLSGICAGSLALLLRIAERGFGRGPSLLLAGSLRALLFGGGFVAFATCLRLLDENAAALPLGRTGAWCWPPYWAARWLGNATDLLALGLLLGTGAALWLANAFSSEVPRPRAHTRTQRRFQPIAALEHRLARRGPLFGATRFVARMLYRSPSFRARVLPLLGVPVAMTVLAYLGKEEHGRRLLLGMTLQFPAIYLPLLIAFLPNAERAGTGWVFDSSPGATLAVAREASLIALTTRVLTPVLGLGATLAFLTGDAPIALAGTVLFSWGVAVWLATIQLRDLSAMPFSRDETAQSDGDLGNLFGFGIVLAAAGGAFSHFADSPAVAALGAAIALSAAWRLHRSPIHAQRT